MNVQWLWRLIGRIPCLRHEVIVQLADGSALQGVLYEVVGDWFVLKAARYLVEGRGPTAVDGDAVVDRARILFIQVVK